MIVFLLLSLPLFAVSFDIPEEFDDVWTNIGNVMIVRDSCAPPSTFNHTLVTSKTISKFPKQRLVCAMLINEKSDVSQKQLNKAFRNLAHFSGNITIENTNLTDLSFFRSQEGYGFFVCDKLSINIVNNSNLVNVSSLYYFNPENLWGDPCPLKILNNPKLDASGVCKSQSFNANIDLEVYGNKKDCGCKGGAFTSETIKNLENCKTVYGGLKLSQMNISDVKYISKLRTINGDVEIYNTSFTDLSFLKDVHRIRARCNESCRKIALNIHDNPLMTRLNIPLTLEVDNVIYALARFTFENLHPDFCVTYNEMTTGLFQWFYIVKNMHGKFCEDISDTPKNQTLCKFETMASLPDGCTWIRDDVLIGSGDEEYKDKLSNVTYIFGTLTIVNTNLKDLNFLSNLEHMMSLRENITLVTVTNNTELESFFGLYYMRTRDYSNRVTLSGNPKLINNTYKCITAEGAFGHKVQFTVDGETCHDFTQKKKLKDEKEKSLLNQGTGYLKFDLYSLLAVFIFVSPYP